MAIPGVVGFRAYRPATGTSQVVFTYEFADMAAWASWRRDDNIQKVMDELHTLALNINAEVWGPSKIVPEPIQSGK